MKDDFDEKPGALPQDHLYREIIEAIDQHPEISVYTIVGVLEMVKHSVMERWLNAP